MCLSLSSVVKNLQIYVSKIVSKNPFYLEDFGTFIKQSSLTKDWIAYKVLDKVSPTFSKFLMFLNFLEF